MLILVFVSLYITYNFYFVHLVFVWSSEISCNVLNSEF